MSLDLRPLTLGELLDRAFTLYKRHLWLLVGIMAVPSALGLVLNVALESFNRRNTSRMQQILANPEEGVLVFGMLVGGMLAGAVVYLTIYTIALGAITLAVSEIYQGRTTTIRHVLREMRPRLARLLWLMVVTTARIGAVALAGILVSGVFAGMLAVLVSPIAAPIVLLPLTLATAVACFLMMLRYGVAVPALVLEDTGAGESIRRSVQLTRGRLGRVFLLVLCATIIAYAAGMLLQGPFLAGSVLAGPESAWSYWLAITGIVAGTIGGTFTGPIIIVALALQYYDARVRDEGLDLQLMLDALEAPAAPQLARG